MREEQKIQNKRITKTEIKNKSERKRIKKIREEKVCNLEEKNSKSMYFERKNTKNSKSKYFRRKLEFIK